MVCGDSGVGGLYKGAMAGMVERDVLGSLVLGIFKVLGREDIGLVLKCPYYTPIYSSMLQITIRAPV